MIILNSGRLLKSAVTKSLEEIQCKSKKVERKYSVVGVKVDLKQYIFLIPPP